MKLEKEILVFRVCKLLSAVTHGWTMATYVLFLQSKGIDLLGANMLNTIYMSLSFLLDPPTGWLADRFGQKRIYLLGAMLWPGAMFYYAFSTGFWQFAIAESVAAIAAVLMSEALESWITNLFGEEVRKREHANGQIIEKISGAITGAAGGFAASYFGEVAPWLIGGSLGVIGWIASHILLAKTRDGVSDKARKEAKVNLAEIVKKSWKVYSIRYTILIAAFYCAACASLNMFWGPILKEAFGGANWIGLVWVGVAGFSALGDLWSKKLEYYRLWLVIVATALPITLAVWLSDMSPLLLLAGFLIHEIGRGAFGNVLKSWSSDSIEDSERSTVYSMQSAGRTGGYAFGLVVTGVASVYISPLTIWAACSALLLVLALWARKKVV